MNKELDNTLLINKAEQKLHEIFRGLELVRDINQEKVLRAFQDNKVGEEHFYTVSGYGHDDLGREIIDKVYAQIFNSEAALVRNHFVSGTHAIACGFFGILRHGDHLVSVSGKPYDTLEEVIGTRGNNQSSLKAHGVRYSQAETEDIEKVVDEHTTMAFIQRSRGYSLRNPLNMEDIADIVERVKFRNPKCICFVDNCYGEFTEAMEPTDVGADLIAGSLIKNPGGGIVETGGYLAGKKKLVELAADRLTAPGIGAKGGAMLNQSRLILQGLFMAPGIVHEALKGAVLASQVFLDMGYETRPQPDELRTDIIQAIVFNDREKLIDFCKTIQQMSPVDSYLTPVPDQVPGYGDDVIMAAGTFIEGSTIELSADGPLREPYTAFMQGGLNYAHVKLALKGIVK